MKTSTRGPSIMLAWGIAGLVLALLGAIAAIVGISGMTAMQSGARVLTLAGTTEGGMQARVTGLEPGKEYVLCSTRALDPEEVRITTGGADGAEVQGSVPDTRVGVAVRNRSVTPRVLFTAGGDGSYEFTFAEDTSLSPITSMAVLEYAPIERFGQNFAMMMGGIFLVVLAGPVGLGLTIAGGAWRSSRKHNARLVAQGQAMPAETPSGR